MDKKQCIAVSGLLFAVGIACPEAGAQCTGYSANVTYTPLAPSDVAQRGGVTATIATWGAYLSGAAPSHNVTGTPGMQAAIRWNSSNGVSATSYYTVDNGTTRYSTGLNISLNGEDDTNPYWVMTSSDVGHTFHIFYVVTDANGNTTSDRINISVVAGPNNTFVSQDMLPINGYAQVTINFGGGSMMNNCSECQAGSTQHCLQATHTPYVTMTAVNSTSGESQSLPRQQAGNVATATESVSGSGSIWISLLPGDNVTGVANAEILCSMFGDLPVSGNDDWGIDWELAWTKFSTIQSSCLPAGGNPPSIGCKVTSKYMCNTKSQPADLQINQVFAEYDTNGHPVTLETVPPFWWGWGFGIRGHVSMFKTPWIFPANVLQQYTVSDLPSWAHVVLEVAAGAFPSNSTIRNCTNKDAGTSPEVVPPLDQP